MHRTSEAGRATLQRSLPLCKRLDRSLPSSVAELLRRTGVLPRFAKDWGHYRIVYFSLAVGKAGAVAVLSVNVIHLREDFDRGIKARHCLFPIPLSIIPPSMVGLLRRCVRRLWRGLFLHGFFSPITSRIKSTMNSSTMVTSSVSIHWLMRSWLNNW